MTNDSLEPYVLYRLAFAQPDSRKIRSTPIALIPLAANSRVAVARSRSAGLAGRDGSVRAVLPVCSVDAMVTKLSDFGTRQIGLSVTPSTLQLPDDGLLVDFADRGCRQRGHLRQHIRPNMPGHTTLVQVVVQLRQRHGFVRENNCRADFFA